ncbi:unnamed protein product [Linum trigynum]|uniref:Uncharacterized protein n=1 Tax=Linum trigynum TaxID=586398 RepID=A0AAV2FUC1_9ROSI
MPPQASCWRKGLSRSKHQSSPNRLLRFCGSAATLVWAADSDDGDGGLRGLEIETKTEMKRDEADLCPDLGIGDGDDATRRRRHILDGLWPDEGGTDGSLSSIFLASL